MKAAAENTIMSEKIARIIHERVGEELKIFISSMNSIMIEEEGLRVKYKIHTAIYFVGHFHE